MPSPSKPKHTTMKAKMDKENEIEEKKTPIDGEYRGYWGTGEVIFFDGHETFNMKAKGGTHGYRSPCKIVVSNGKISKLELS